jgi:(2S)-methylsuccinyl-CoA dehydrogenase
MESQQRDELLKQARAVLEHAEGVYEQARAAVRGRCLKDGRVSGGKLDQEQPAAHALAYMATELEAARQMLAYGERAVRLLDHPELELGLTAAWIASVVSNFGGAVELSALEKMPVAELGLEPAALDGSVRSPEALAFVREHGSAAAHVGLAHLLAERRVFGGDPLLEDEVLRLTRGEFARFANERVIPMAPRVHDNDELIPMELLQEMAELGVFGLTIGEEHGGAGLGTTAMVVVTEELSRGYIGVGSLGTRAEIAAELIGLAGTDEQKKDWLPRIASGEVLPTAVFTEPDFGSDLAHIRTRAVKVEGGYRITGQKTWATHASRADMMTLLARTDPEKPGYDGLSMFLAEKRRATEGEDFPDPEITGSEIRVLGYRGMKEYELSFQDYFVPDSALLGGVEGQGFKQLMTTFEAARIQTAARGVGLAQAALEEALRYAEGRVQFGKPIIELPRVAWKLGRMAVLIQAARQLTYHAAQRKDLAVRCDLEAGMAKLLATRAAWQVADEGVQVHGGNGYATEFTASRLLVDARVLSIFEGANEIQAHVVARRLLEER